MDTFDLEQARVFLNHSRTAALATADEHGRPHAANLQVAANAALNLLWVSSPKSLHSRHLMHRPEAAVTVYGHDDQVLQIHGLQLRGTVRALTPESAEWHDAFEVYTDKFSVAASMPQLREAIVSQTFYCFAATWMRWIDNRVRFGFKAEWTADADGDAPGDG